MSQAELAGIAAFFGHIRLPFRRGKYSGWLVNCFGGMIDENVWTNLARRRLNRAAIFIPKGDPRGAIPQRPLRRCASQSIIRRSESGGTKDRSTGWKTQRRLRGTIWTS